MNTNGKKLAWHFVGETLRDGSPVPPDGLWLEYPRKCVMHALGLYASGEPFDALINAQGDILCLVEVDGIEGEYLYQLVCHRRRIIARMDATEMLRYYARMQAISCLDYWDRDPPQVVLEWLWTGDESIRAAAKSAAESVAGPASRSGEWSAAQSAELSAARSAELSAVWSAVESAAASAVWPGWGQQMARANFNTLVYECFEGVLAS